MPEQPSTVAAFVAELLAVTERWLQHFDPGTELAANVVRLEVSGPSLNLVFDQRGTEPPSLRVDLLGVGGVPGLAPHDSPEAAEGRLRLRRG